MLKILKKRKITLGALIFLLIILVCALFAGILSPYDPNTQEISARLTFSGVIICSAPIILEGIFCQELFMEVK